MSNRPPDHVTEIRQPSFIPVTDRLVRPVDATRDHVIGPGNAPITLVEYGSYACQHCRAANERITDVRGQLGDRLTYVFRHQPLVGNEMAWRAAALAESAANDELFWEAHVTLMSRSESLTEDDLRAVAERLDLPRVNANLAQMIGERARRRVHADVDDARASGVRFTPTFFINGRRYDPGMTVHSRTRCLVLWGIAYERPL